MTIEEAMDARQKMREEAEKMIAAGDTENGERMFLIALRLGNVILKAKGLPQCGPPELQQ